jgi:hypothetical protein
MGTAETREGDEDETIDDTTELDPEEPEAPA